MTDAAAGGAPALPGLSFVKELGRGGFAEVFLYEQEQPRMRVAVKVLRADGMTDTARERFAAEANAMAELADHPNIVQVFRSDVTGDGRPYMVMKYYPQRNLAVRSRAERIPVPEVLQLGIRIASAVETAHRAGILHRDIKPANILTSQYGEPGLTDFGIATTVGTGRSDEADGMSVPWSPPEVLFGRSQGDQLSDVYSLGATIWHLLVGRSPFEEPGGDNSTVALMRRIKEQPPPRTGREDVPASLERALAQAMAKNPDERPASALLFARSLQAVEAEQRWAPTPLVLLDDTEAPDDAGDGPAGREGTDEDPATRLRRPQEVRPDGSAPAAPAEDATRRRGVAVPGPRAPRVRQGMPAAAEGGATVRKAAPVVAADRPEDEATGKDQDKGRPRWLVAGAAAAAVAVVVGVGVALAGHGKTASTSPTTNPGPAPTAVVAPSNTPTVTATRVDATQVKYSWTDPGGQPGDTFAVSVAGGPYRSNGTSTDLVLAVPAGQQKCITVEIIRDGAAGPAGGNC